MKHNLKITVILITMFFISQLIGIYVANAYSPEIVQQVNSQTGISENITVHDIPYGLEPPQNVKPENTIWQIIIALAIAIILMLALMKFKAEAFLRIWFFVVVVLGIALALNAFIKSFESAAIISLIIALPFAYFKIFKQNLLIHNITELFIYPGISTVFIPLLNVPTVVILLILISIYDAYAVWHSGFMQKMAKYQIEKVKVFSGFFVPYLGKNERAKIKKLGKSKNKDKRRKIGANIAILGGGDVVFPMILAGVVLRAFNIWSAVIIAIGATAALGWLFYISKKGKFYPAMPFITVGCFVALGIVYLLN